MSSGENYYLLASLPVLGEPGAPPPLSLAEMRVRASRSNAATLVDAILLADDLRLRQGLLAGELTAVEPVVIASDQITGPSPLPDVLAVEERDDSGRRAEDLIWEAYWHHAARVARRRRSPFMRAWVGMEVALRNALAAARARALGQSVEAHQVAAQLGWDNAVVENCVTAWAAAADPLAGLRVLLRTRWDWVTKEERRYSFSQDEVAAYAAKLVLLVEWRRSMGVAA